MIISKQMKTLLLLTFRNRADILLLRFQNGYRKSMRESLNLMRIVPNYFILNPGFRWSYAYAIMIAFVSSQ